MGQDKATFIYFIQCDGPGQPIKVGHARNPDERLSNLQMGCPYPLRLLAKMAVEDGEAIEGHLHLKLNSLHIRGEWFMSSPDLMRLVNLAAHHQEERVAAVWASEPLPALPAEFVPSDDFESVPADVVEDVQRLLADIRRDSLRRTKERHDRRRGATPLTAQERRELRRAEKAPAGSFMWRGKLRAP